MNEAQRLLLFSQMMNLDGNEAEFVVERVEVVPGRSFSPTALDELNDELAAWIGTRIMRRWEATEEPPSILNVTIRVVAS